MATPTTDAGGVSYLRTADVLESTGEAYDFRRPVEVD